MNCYQIHSNFYEFWEISSAFPPKIERFRFFNSKLYFTLNAFDYQERNLTFVKTDYQVLKLKFHACNVKQAFYLLQ